MVSASPRVEQKPHDGDNQVTVLEDCGASGNYFDDQLILQPSQLSPLQGLQPSLLDFLEDTLNDNYVSSKEMSRDVCNYTAALDLNINTPADRGGLHSELQQGRISSSGERRLKN